MVAWLSGSLSLPLSLSPSLYFCASLLLSALVDLLCMAAPCPHPPRQPGHLFPGKAKVRRLFEALPRRGTGNGHRPRDRRAHRRAPRPVVPHHRPAKRSRAWLETGFCKPWPVVRFGQGHGRQRPGGDQQSGCDRRAEGVLSGMAGRLLLFILLFLVLLRQCE